MSFCNNCGKEIAENSKFCNACGAKVASVNAEVASSSNDKQEEKVFFKCNGTGKELMISNELIKCSYKKIIGTEIISIIPKNINSFEYKSNAAYRILGVVLLLMSIIIFIPLTQVSTDKMSMTVAIVLLSLSFICFCFGFLYIFVVPSIEIFSGTAKYMLPIKLFGSKEELLKAIQSAISYRK